MSAPSPEYSQRNGLAGASVFHVYEDRDGHIWVNTISGLQPRLMRWHRETSTFRHFSSADGWPLDAWINSFGEDASGNLWIATSGRGVARYKGGRFEFFTTADGLPANAIIASHLDSSGSLWLTSDAGGAVRVADPAAARPVFRIYGVAQGLSSNQTYGVTEDRFGRMYIATGRGVDRIDPATGHIRHYAAAEGLTLGPLSFGTGRGRSGLAPTKRCRV